MADYVVIGSSDCTWCDKANQLLVENTKSGYHHRYFKLEYNEWLKPLLKMADLRTVPQVFVDGQHIGGYEDLKSHLEEVNGRTV